MSLQLFLAAALLPLVFACSNNNVVCMNKEAVAATNVIRREAGLRPLQIGTKAMLQNALQHSRVMASKDNLYHQPVGSGLYVGSGLCRAMLSAENIAYNFVERGASPAQKCVKQWRESPGHYRNIVGRNHVNVVVAIFVSGNKIWCTQTFSTVPAGGSGECAVVGGGGGGRGGDWGDEKGERGEDDDDYDKDREDENFDQRRNKGGGFRVKRWDGSGGGREQRRFLSSNFGNGR